MSVQRELIDEFQVVFSSRGRVFDAVIPPLVFLELNRVNDLKTALCGAL